MRPSVVDQHPTAEVFERMTRGTATPEETRSAVRHLLRACPDCSRLTQASRTVAIEPPASPQTYDEVFERLHRKVAAGLLRVEKERESARQLYAELLEQEAVQGLTQVHST